MTKNAPNRQQLAKAERIIHDMEGALWKLYEIFGYSNCKDVLSKFHEIESLLWDIRRNTLSKFADTKCRYCNRPVFTPVFTEYRNEGLQPFHKRCVAKLSNVSSHPNRTPAET